MSFLRDKWEWLAVFAAIVLVAAGGYQRTKLTDSRLERFERRLFNSTWRISGDEIRCEPPKE